MYWSQEQGSDREAAGRLRHYDRQQEALRHGQGECRGLQDQSLGSTSWRLQPQRSLVEGDEQQDYGPMVKNAWNVAMHALHTILVE